MLLAASSCATYKHVKELINPLLDLDLQLLHEYASWVQFLQEACTTQQQEHMPVPKKQARVRQVDNVHGHMYKCRYCVGFDTATQ